MDNTKDISPGITGNDRPSSTEEKPGPEDDTMSSDSTDHPNPTGGGDPDPD